MSGRRYAFLLLLAAGPAAGAVPGQVDLSADLFAQVLGVDVEANEVARVGTSATIRFSDVHEPVDLTAWLETTSSLAGTEMTVLRSAPVFAIGTADWLDGTVVTARDLMTIHTKLEVAELVWSGAAAGVPDGVAVDAAAQDGDAWLLSFDVTVELDGLVADDEDVVRWRDGEGWVDLLDLTGFGVPPELDLDGLERRTNGRLWLSFDGSGEIDGVAFDDDDVLELSLETGQWRKTVDGADDLDLADGADLDALGVTPFVFRDGFESGGTTRWSSTVS